MKGYLNHLIHPTKFLNYDLTIDVRNQALYDLEKALSIIVKMISHAVTRKPMIRAPSSVGTSNDDVGKSFDCRGSGVGNSKLCVGRCSSGSNQV